MLTVVELDNATDNATPVIALSAPLPAAYELDAVVGRVNVIVPEAVPIVVMTICAVTNTADPDMANFDITPTVVAIPVDGTTAPI